MGSYKRAHGQCNTSVLEFSHNYYGCGRIFKNLPDFLNAVIAIYKVPLPPDLLYTIPYKKSSDNVDQELDVAVTEKEDIFDANAGSESLIYAKLGFFGGSPAMPSVSSRASQTRKCFDISFNTDYSPTP